MNGSENASQATEIEILKMVLQSYADEYHDMSETWRHLDAKGQGATGIGGIFVAATFAFAREIATDVSTMELTMLVITVGVLLISIGCAIKGLALRPLEAPPMGESFESLTNALLSVKDPRERAERLPRLIGDQVALWKENNEAIAKASLSKAECIRWSQKLLFVVIIMAGLIAILHMWP